MRMFMLDVFGRIAGHIKCKKKSTALVYVAGTSDTSSEETDDETDESKWYFCQIISTYERA